MKSTKYVLLLITIILTLALLISCSQADESAFIPEEGPLMWLVTAPDGQTMYMFGSIHIGNEDTYPLPDHIMDAFERSDYLAVEINVTEIGIDDLTQVWERMQYPDGYTIIDYIGQELHQQLTDILSEHGVPPGVLDSFHPFMWFSTLNEIAVSLSGFFPEYGIDDFFILEAMERGMEILEVESYESQMDMFFNFSQPLWIELLNPYNMDDELDAIRELYRYWTRGDFESIYQLMMFDPEESFPEELHSEYIDALLRQRDLAMADKAQQYMAEGKNVFFVVGVLHLVGENSVTGLLSQRGYDVQIVSGNPG